MPKINIKDIEKIENEQLPEKVKQKIKKLKENKPITKK